MPSPEELIKQDSCLDWFYKTSPKSTACDNKKEPILQLPAPVAPGGGSKNGKRKKKKPTRKLPYMLE